MYKYCDVKNFENKNGELSNLRRKKDTLQI